AASTTRCSTRSKECSEKISTPAVSRRSNRSRTRATSAISGPLGPRWPAGRRERRFDKASPILSRYSAWTDVLSVLHQHCATVSRSRAVGSLLQPQEGQNQKRDDPPERRLGGQVL